MCAHKHFRRKVSKSLVFLIKVKNIYILATKTGLFLKFLPFRARGVAFYHTPLHWLYAAISGVP